jgi:gluconolactonase
MIGSTWRPAQALRKVCLTALVSTVALGAALAPAADGVEVVATDLQFPEGTIFVGSTLYFVDYVSSDVLRLNGRKTEVVWHRDGCGPNGLAAVPAGLLVACYDSGTVVQISLDGKILETLRADDHGQPFVAPNDLATDARGGVYFTASGNASVTGKVYYRSADRRVREVASGIRYANGLVVSLDGKTLYLAESSADRLLAFAVAADGALSGQRVFVRLADVLSVPGQAAYTPDGVRIDTHGNLFIGLYRGGGCAVISPDAKLVKYLALPAPHHANLAIAADGKTLFVTSTYDAPGGGYRGELLKVANPLESR